MTCSIQCCNNVEVLDTVLDIPKKEDQSIQTDIAYIGEREYYHGIDIQSELEFGRRLAWIKQRTSWLVAAVQQEGSDVLRQVYQDLGDIIDSYATDTVDSCTANGSGKANSV
jgi:hypothetical protein